MGIITKSPQQRLFCHLLSGRDGFGKKFRRARLAVLLAFTKLRIAEIPLSSDVGKDRCITVEILVGSRNTCFMTAGIVEAA